MNMDYTNENTWSIDEIKQYLKNNVKEKRYEHILGVAEAAKSLAEQYGENIEHAEIAAYYHDILKDKNFEWLVSYIREMGEDPGEGLSAWKTLHAQAGAIFARSEAGLNDQRILDAVRYHTTGRENMSLLEKIIFVADFIEAGRVFEGVELIRDLAKSDLDQAVLASLNSSISYLKEQNAYVMSTSLEAQIYYRNLISERTADEKYNESY